MSLNHYRALIEQLNAKTRGRKHSFKLCKAPELWVSKATYGDNIYVHYESGGNCVCTLKPDNSMEITFGHWHTQCTTKIVYELAGYGAGMHDSHIWYGTYPTAGGVLRFDTGRNYIPPAQFVELKAKALYRLQGLTLAPEVRLRLEIGQWKPKAAVTQAVKDFALGKISCENLTARDQFTCATAHDSIIYKLLKEAA